MKRQTIGSVAAACLLLAATTGCDLVHVIGNHVAGNKKVTRTDSLTMAIPASGQIRIETQNGTIRCIGGDVPSIEIEAEVTARATSIDRAGEDLDRIEISRTEEDGIGRLTAKVPGGVNGKVAFTVVVPAELSVTLETSNGAINVNDVNGSVFAESSNGKIQISGSKLSSMNARTSNGAIRVTGSLLPGKHSLETSNGSIKAQLTGAAVAVTASTGNGRIQVNSHKVKKGDTVVVGAGDTRPSVNQIARLSAETSNGSITVQHQPELSDTDSPYRRL